MPDVPMDRKSRYYQVTFASRQPLGLQSLFVMQFCYHLLNI